MTTQYDIAVAAKDLMEVAEATDLLFQMNEAGEVVVRDTEGLFESDEWQRIAFALNDCKSGISALLIDALRKRFEDAASAARVEAQTILGTLAAPVREA